MQDDATELEELAREIHRVIADNRKFLDHVLDDDFEPEEDDLPQEEVVEEL
jgi:hypothetical protein